MGWLGKSKEDTSQDASLVEVWKWLKALNTNQATILKNQSILITNNSYFIKHIGLLKQKDIVHDQTDQEHLTLIKGFKDMAKAVESIELEEG